jgi:hypothetical protein
MRTQPWKTRTLLTAAAFLSVALLSSTGQRAEASGGEELQSNAVTNVSVSSGASMLPVMKTDADGKVHLAWMDDTDNSEIFYSQWNGEKWSPPTNVSNNETGSLFPSMAVESSGKVHLTWMDGQGEEFDIYYSQRAGTEWSRPLNISDLKGISQRPRIAADSCGTIHVVWYDNVNGFFQLFHCRLERGVWSQPIKTGLVGWYITHDPYLVASPGLAADNRGHVHIVWVDIHDYTQDLFHSCWDGKTWSQPTNISKKPERPREQQIETDAKGNLHITWNDNGVIWYCCREHQSWSEPLRISEIGVESNLPTICVAHNGDIHIAWDAIVSGKPQLLHRRIHGGVCTETKRLTASSGSSVAAVITQEASGTLHLAWMDDTSGNFEIFHRSGLCKE